MDSSSGVTLNARNAYWRWLVFFGCLGGLIASTHMPPSVVSIQETVEELGGDKTVHVIAYFVLTLTALFAFSMPRSRQAVLLLGAALLALAALDELTQPWFGRTADWLDWLADSVGITLGIICTRMDPQRLKGS